MKFCVKYLYLSLFFVLVVGFANAQLSVNPSMLQYGYVGVGSTVTKQLELSTSATISIAGLPITGISYADFSVSGIDLPYTLIPGSPKTINVTFMPLSIGYSMGTLEITDSYAMSTPVELRGNGADPNSPMINIPSSLNFGDVTIGTGGSNLDINVNLSPEWIDMYVTGTIDSIYTTGDVGFSVVAIKDATTLEIVELPAILSATSSLIITIDCNPMEANELYGELKILGRDGVTYSTQLVAMGKTHTPMMIITPYPVEIDVMEGSYATRDIYVHNFGGGVLNFTIIDTDCPPWMEFSLLTGNVNSGDSLLISISIDGTTAPVDTHSYLFDINSNDPGGDYPNIMVTVNVGSLPLVADFGAPILEGHPSFTVAFSDNSHSDPDMPWVTINSWKWDFNNDGVFDSFVQHPVHTYTNPGIFSVRLVIGTNSGATASKLRTDYINAVNSAPVVVNPINTIAMFEDITWGPEAVPGIFSDPDYDNFIVSCQGSEHLTATLVSGYLKIVPYPNWYGIETIVIIATDIFGASAQHDVVVTVASVNDAPILSIPTDLYFIRNSHYTVDFSPWIDDPDNPDSELSLYLDPIQGLGNVTFAYTPINVPNTLGQLAVTFSSLSQFSTATTIRASVNDNMGRIIAFGTFTMHVLEQFNPQINIAANYQFAGQTVDFIDATLGNPDYWLWEYGDGQTSTEQSPDHQYLQAGTYTVRLTLGNTEANESAIREIPGMIHLIGTAITNTNIPPTWTLQGSPYNLYGAVVIDETANIQIQPDVQINMFGQQPLVVQGSFNANGAVFQPQGGTGFWGGMEFRSGNNRNPSVLTNCEIIDALHPLDIEGSNPSIIGITISVSDTTVFSPGAALRLVDSNAIINGAVINNYLGGVLIDNVSGSRTTPTLTNIRVRNSTSTLRDVTEPSTGITIKSGANLTDVRTDNFDTGIRIGTDLAGASATPTLTNIRVRNSSSTLRAVVSGTGITISGNAAPSLSDVVISEVAVGILIDNVTSTVRNTPTLTNIRVRNSTSTLRSITNGLIVLNTPYLALEDIEIDEFATGILIQADTRGESTPTLTNIRVRNSTSTLRTETTGISVVGSVIARLNNVQVEEYSTGINYDLAGVSSSRNTPTLTNIRVRNSTSTLRQLKNGAVFSGFGKLTINDMEITNCGMGLRLLAPEIRAESTPTLTNIRVRNSTSTLREESIGIYLGSGIKGTLSGSVVDSLDIGILIADGNRTALDNNKIMDCKTGIRASGTNPLPIKKQVFLLRYPLPNSCAIELFGNGPWDVHQNTMNKYSIGVRAINAVVNFHSNIMWHVISLFPFENTNSTINNSYNDIFSPQVVFPGLGNISANPCFVSAETLDFRITRESPCIDAGNPALPREADGSIADMGAFTYVHRASGATNTRFIVAGTQVNFTNTSIGHDYGDTSVAWDIGNDGMVDYTSRGCSHTFNNAGLYDVRLRMQSGLLTDEVIYERFVVVSTNLLAPPSNPAIAREGNDIIVSWEAVLHGATEVPYYVVFSSDSPNGYFRYKGFNTSSHLTFRDAGAALADKAFYIVIGFKGSRGELMEYIDKQKQGQGLRSKQ
ncbi:hypothetical protein MASR2M64_00290 [Candidatus Cloacimonadota bacterium]